MVRRHAPWYTESLRDVKCCRRRFERLWRYSKEEADLLAYRQQDLLAYRQQCRSVSMQLTEAKRD